MVRMVRLMTYEPISMPLSALELVSPAA